MLTHSSDETHQKIYCSKYDETQKEVVYLRGVLLGLGLGFIWG